MLIILTTYKETFPNVGLLDIIIYMVFYRIRNKVYPFLNYVIYLELSVILFI